MGTTSRGFPYPAFSDSAAPPDHFYNLATSLDNYFSNYDGFVNTQVGNAYNNLAGQISNVDTNRINADSSLSGRIDTVNNRISGLIQGGSWTPGFGGSNANVGANSGAEGHWTMVGDEGTFRGRIVFGSSASFGNGTAVVSNIPINVKKETSTGTGYFDNGANQVGIFFIPVDTTSFAIRRIKNDGNLGLGYDLGTPPQSSVLVFELKGTRA